jgi:hypothetical protein
MDQQKIQSQLHHMALQLAVDMPRQITPEEIVRQHGILAAAILDLQKQLNGLGSSFTKGAQELQALTRQQNQALNSIRR